VWGHCHYFLFLKINSSTPILPHKWNALRERVSRVKKIWIILKAHIYLFFQYKNREWVREANNDKILTHVKKRLREDGWERLEKTSFIISLHFRTIINLFRLSKMSFYFIYVFSFFFFLNSRPKLSGEKILLWINFSHFYKKNW
jgi:hypothetical protein